MPGRVETEHLDVQHVRDEGQRMPVAVDECGYRPNEVVLSQPLTDPGILRDVDVVVVVHEPEIANRRIDGNRHNNENGGEDEIEAQALAIHVRDQRIGPLSRMGSGSAFPRDRHSA